MGNRGNGMTGSNGSSGAFRAKGVDFTFAVDIIRGLCAGPTGKGRSDMGMINNTGCTTVWGSTYPFNPYPFPWANHLFQDGPSVAMGIFEAHARQMGDGFKAIRIAELECDDAYSTEEHERYFELFDWEDFTDEEMHLMPPVTVLGGDGAMLDIGFQNLSRALISGRPLKGKLCLPVTQIRKRLGGGVADFHHRTFVLEYPDDQVCMFMGAQ